MMLWWKKIKDVFALSARIENLSAEIKEFDKQMKHSMRLHTKEFEKKIQEMTFAYTKNLDDTKSDYLKRYLEVRLNCMQQELSSIPSRLAGMQNEILKLESKMEAGEQD